MNTVELTQYALSNAFDLLQQVVADLTQEQADWVPPGTASTIGAVYSHTITYVDFIVQRVCIGQSDADFAEPPPEEIRMQQVQVDLSALHEYADQVQSAAQEWLSTLTPADLDRRRNTSAGELNLGQLLESYIIWHINAHCGEISALKGCQGLSGYPW
jgi:uncharacterized damage-inducible protein DinB